MPCTWAAASGQLACWRACIKRLQSQSTVGPGAGVAAAAAAPAIDPHLRVPRRCVQCFNLLQVFQALRVARHCRRAALERVIRQRHELVQGILQGRCAREPQGTNTRVCAKRFVNSCVLRPGRADSQVRFIRPDFRSTHLLGAAAAVRAGPLDQNTIWQSRYDRADSEEFEEVHLLCPPHSVHECDPAAAQGSRLPRRLLLLAWMRPPRPASHAVWVSRFDCTLNRMGTSFSVARCAAARAGPLQMLPEKHQDVQMCKGEGQQLLSLRAATAPLPCVRAPQHRL